MGAVMPLAVKSRRADRKGKLSQGQSREVGARAAPLWFGQIGQFDAGGASAIVFPASRFPRKVRGDDARTWTPKTRAEGVAKTMGCGYRPLIDVLRRWVSAKISTDAPCLLRTPRKVKPRGAFWRSVKPAHWAYRLPFLRGLLPAPEWAPGSFALQGVGNPQRHACSPFSGYQGERVKPLPQPPRQFLPGIVERSWVSWAMMPAAQAGGVVIPGLQSSGFRFGTARQVVSEHRAPKATGDAAIPFPQPSQVPRRADAAFDKVGGNVSHDRAHRP